MKTVRPLLADTWEGLRSRPGRTAFAVAALSVGMSALTVLAALLNGLRQRSRDVVKELGANVIAVVDRNGPGAGFRERHVRALEAGLPACDISPVRRHRVQTGDGPAIEIIGTDERLLGIRQWHVDRGRRLDRRDLSGARRHAVISRELALQDGRRPGDILALGRTPFRVIGIVDTGGAPGVDREGQAEVAWGERTAFVPHTVRPDWDRGGRRPPTGFTGLFLRSPDGIAPERMERIARRLLAQPGLRGGALSWVTPERLLRGVRRLQVTIRLTAGSVAVLSLLLGGMALAGLLSANVRERVPEIGLRRALGATRGDIARLFVLEAVGITAAAAACGGIAGWTILLAVPALWPVPIRPGLLTVTAPPLIGIALGIFFAYGPARMAAAIRPADALRNP